MSQEQRNKLRVTEKNIARVVGLLMQAARDRTSREVLIFYKELAELNDKRLAIVGKAVA